MFKSNRVSLIVEIFIFFLLVIFYLQHSLILSTPLKFYSTFIPYRLQTDAFLQGKISLSQQPFGLPWDYAWVGDHGIHEAWGLGVPLLRLPFEWIAKQCGLDPFPDRVVLIIYLFFMIFCLNIALRLLLRNFGILIHSPLAVFIRFYLIGWFLICPPISWLIQNFLAFEEPVFYGCLYSYILLSLLIIHTVRPTKAVFFSLCLLAGLAWLIRPTLVFYGLVTFIFVLIQTFQKRNNISLIVMGILCFSFGFCVDLWFNYLRFGSILEFGYSVTVDNNPIEMYAHKFGFPFSREPFFSSFKELVGALFFNYSWESKTIRYRVHAASSFYNLSHLIVLVVGFISLSFISLNIYIKKRVGLLVSQNIQIVWILLSWGSVCFLTIFFFYLRCSGLEPRYFSEFAVAFNAILIALILMGVSYIKSNWSGKQGKNSLIIFFLFTGILFFFNNGNFFIYKNKNNNSSSTDRKGVVKLVVTFNKEILVRPSVPE